ncbi:MAG: cytochrome c oxidase, cbb3-type, CcoQ subunit [Helicobacter sp.]|nr:cytochrome c oxidase, cbb3-type, CcoQ subunit [Helicobacter sp.]
MDIDSIRAFAYVGITILLVVFLYAYIFSLYRRQKQGLEDYEKYGKLAINDSLDDEVIDAKRS